VSVATTRRAGRVAVFVCAVLPAAVPVPAQTGSLRARPRAEVRVDYLGPNPNAVQAGAGVNMPVGTYLRVGVIGAGGTGWNDGRSGASLRFDVIGRFSFDPFRERRWGLSSGGGLSVRYDRAAPRSRQWRPLLALVVDLEGQRVGSIAPGVQLGLGGGARVGAIIRAADPNRR
jgi:hypothetical protein